MAVLHGRTILLAAQVMGAGLGRGMWWRQWFHLLRQVGGSKMAAAEEGCGVGVEDDRELEELLESKSARWERPEVSGRGSIVGVRGT